VKKKRPPAAAALNLFSKTERQNFLEQSIPNLFSEATKKHQPDLVRKILARLPTLLANHS
jgi:hypothetical protein